MQKPQEWDNIPAYTGEAQSLPAGAYICKIVKAKEEQTKTGKTAVVFAIDINEGEYRNFFRRQFDSDARSDKKWPAGGVYRQVTEGKSLPYFKGVITSIEVSNAGYKWNWDEKTLNEKLVGAVFGREEYINSEGKAKWGTKCVGLRSVQAVKNGEVAIPEDSPITGKTQNVKNPLYASIPEAEYDVIEGDDDDDLPF